MPGTLTIIDDDGTAEFINELSPLEPLPADHGPMWPGHVTLTASGWRVEKVSAVEWVTTAPDGEVFVIRANMTREV